MNSLHDLVAALALPKRHGGGEQPGKKRPGCPGKGKKAGFSRTPENQEAVLQKRSEGKIPVPKKQNCNCVRS